MVRYPETIATLAITWEPFVHDVDGEAAAARATLRTEIERLQAAELVWAHREQYYARLTLLLCPDYDRTLTVRTTLQQARIPNLVLGQPHFGYRETIGDAIVAEGLYRRQTGCPSHFGHVIVRLEPCGDQGARVDHPCVFERAADENTIPHRYVPGIIAGITDVAMQGVRWKYPLANLRITLVGGGYHEVDSSPYAFQVATIRALESGIAQARPFLVEPLEQLEVRLPREQAAPVIRILAGLGCQQVQVAHDGDDACITGQAVLTRLAHLPSTLPR